MSGALLSLLHLCDSLFPLGGFAHSDGLETATASGQISDGEGLRAWMDICLDENLGRAEGPAVARAWQLFMDGGSTLDGYGAACTSLRHLDAEVHALRPSSSSRQATRAMGTRLLKTWQQIRRPEDVEALRAWLKAGDIGAAGFTLPVAFGLVCASSGIDDRSTLEGFMYTRLAATASCAMRLMAIGQHEAHALLASVLGRVPAVADGVLSRRTEPAAFMPAMDLAAMSQQGRCIHGCFDREGKVKQTVRLGVGGPVGSGKTALVDALCKRMRSDYALGVVTNDIFTREDMEFLVRSEALPADRILGVQTGGCPHTAIREDASMNFDALDELTRRHPDLDLIFLESGGDNLAASFSPELVDAAIYVIDVSGGDKIPRKGGPGVTRSDLLVINKIDLAPMVGASLEVMARDARAGRGDRPFMFTNLKAGVGLEEVVSWIQRELLFDR